MPRLRERSTTDLLILMIAGTICICVIGALAAIAASELIDPDTDTSGAANAVADVINTLIGLLAGFLAGRTELQKVRRERREEDKADA